MRNLNYISALLCAAALVTSCSNEEMMENRTSADGFTLVATTGADTRTTIGEGYKVNWTAGDAFYAFGGATGTPKVYKATAKLTLEGNPSAGTTEAKFTGELAGDISNLQYAVYPRDAYKSETMTVEFPTAYAYSNSNAPMFGKLNAEKTKVNFSNLLSGMMRIELSGLAEGTTGSLTLAGANIAGEAALIIDGGDGSLDEIADGEDAVVVSFTASDADPLVLDIPVPAATYVGGITATLKIGENSKETQVYQTTKNFVVTAGTIKVMPGIGDIKVDASTGDLTFSKVVESAEDAVKELKNGEKNITVNTMAAGEQIEIPSDAGNEPITINVNEVTGNDGSITIKGDNSANNLSVSINVPEGVEGKLKVEDIDHVEINGTWEKVTASTGQNTFVVKAGAVIKDLTVEKGNIEIKGGGEVNKLTLNADMAINKPFFVPVGKQMAIVLGTHTLTLVGDESFGIDNCVRILKDASLTITGDGGSKGQIDDKAKGIALADDNAKFTMKNVNYSADYVHAGGILINLHASNAAAEVDNCTMQSVEYCLSTNAATPVGKDNTIALTNSEFTAKETALMVNTPVTVTATGCTFTGGWQGAFLRGGTFTFDGCSFNLNVNTVYQTSVLPGATSWGGGNNAPAAAITAGNRSGSAYDYKTNITLKNSCSLAVQVGGVDSQDYPAIYLDAEKDKPNQGVTFTDNEATYTTSLAEVGKGFVINNTTGQVIVNGTAYTGGAD
jgi:hypothetical protein